MISHGLAEDIVSHALIPNTCTVFFNVVSQSQSQVLMALSLCLTAHSQIMSSLLDLLKSLEVL